MNYPIEVEYFYKEYALIDALSIPEFEDIISPLVERAVDVAGRALQKAEMDASELNRILLAGGTSQLPLVSDLLARRFGRPTSIVPRDLMWLIAKGAAVHHRNLMTRPREAIEPRLGADLFLETFDRGRLEPVLLIPSHQKIPCTYDRRFAINPQAPYLTVQLLSESGTNGRSLTPLERREITVSGRAVKEIEVKVQVDQSRLIHLSVYNPKTGVALDDSIEIRGDTLLTSDQIRLARQDYGFTEPNGIGSATKQQSVAIGIDLGTTTCEAVVWNPAKESFENGIESELHSKVFVESDPLRITVGTMEKNPGDEGYFENFKADIGTQPGQDSRYIAFDKHWPPEILSAHLLSSVWHELQLKYGTKNTLNEAVITVPSDFTEDQSALVSNAARIAGIQTPILLTEPVSAFLAYVAEFPELASADSNYLVFDFGGGTTDVCIIRTRRSELPEIVASSGDNRIGGKDVTSLLAGNLVERFEKKNGLTLLPEDRDSVNKRALKRAERAKVEISNMLLSL